MPLRIAARVDRADREYFEERIRPLLRRPGIEFLGEVREAEKNALLGGAAALLFPSDRPEPFGLVMIEALACGTPVVAFRRGAVDEVLEHGATGFVVDGVQEAVRAVERLHQVSRLRCRQAFEERYGAPRMARNYLAAYAQLAAGGAPSRLRALRWPARA